MGDGGYCYDSTEEKQQAGEGEIMDDRMPETGSDRGTAN